MGNVSLKFITAFLIVVSSTNSFAACDYSTGAKCTDSIRLSIISNLNSQKASLTTQAASLNTKIQSLNTLVSILSAEKNKLISEKAALSAQIDSLNLKIQALDVQANTLSDSNTKLILEKSELSTQVASLNTEVLALNEKTKIISDEKDKLALENSAQVLVVASLNTKIVELTNQTKSLTDLNSQLSLDKSTLSTENGVLRLGIEDLQKKLDALSGTGTTTTGGIACDGVNNNTGTTSCYYKNIPTIQVMGVTTANIGRTIWNSRNNLGASFQNNFVTDEIFNVRIVPKIAIKTDTAVNPSVAGKSCNHLMTKIATKLLVRLKLQTKEEDLAGSADGEVATLEAAIDQPSTVWHFAKRPSTTNLVLKVVSVLSDSRCQQGGTGYCPYSDIPLSNPTIATIPTECVAFDIQYSTDDTFDLPGAAAN